MLSVAHCVLGLIPDTRVWDAAAISYFSLFALFPAILVMIALADAFIILRNCTDLCRIWPFALFPGSRAYLRQNIAEISSPTPTVVLSCLFVVVWASMWVFTFIENSFDREFGYMQEAHFLGKARFREA
ncbi:MAG: YihY/virulence factor BrkB family protein [Ignavibacteriales bacterium]|nr:YihY/virulence factor BrkB family protein [Ignavibacteriales bacterium]